MGSEQWICTVQTGDANDVLTEANKILKRCSEKTYYNHDISGNFIIDFVEYPDWSSGGGRCEQVESRALALAAGNLDNGLESLPEYAPIYEVTDRMDLPEVCKGEIKALVREARDYTGHPIADLTWKDIVYTGIEDAGEFNGYEWCRFEGDSMYELFGEEYIFHIVGYTTFLKGSGLPMWVVAIDTTEDQSMNDRLEDLAKNCANTLLEVPDEVMDYFPYNAG